MSFKNGQEKDSFKVVLVGNKYAGKTSLSERYFRNRFEYEQITTIGAFYNSKKFNVHGKDYEMGVWDTSGEEKYRSISSMYYRDAIAAIICFDLTEPVTSETLNYWIEEVQNIVPLCKIYFCATKSDLVEDVSLAHNNIDLAKSVAVEHSGKVYVTSSKIGTEVVSVFEEVFEDYLSDLQSRELKKADTIKLPSGHLRKEKRKKKCCSD